MRLFLLLALSALFAPGCSSPPTEVVPGVPVVADAIVDVAFADLGVFADLVSRAAGSGLLPKESRLLSQSGLEAAGLAAPLVAAVRGSGDLVVVGRLVDATRFVAALSLALPEGARLERRHGKVDAIVVEGKDVVLVRAGDGLVVVVIDPTDPLASATLVEALADGSLPAVRRNPTETTVSSGPGLLAAVAGLRLLTGTLRAEGDDVVLSLVAGVSGDLVGLVAGLDAVAPAWACAVEDGAALSVRLPPASAQALTDLVAAPGGSRDLDAFQGRLLVALHEVGTGTPVVADDKTTWASLVVAGHPRVGGAATLRETLNEAAPSATPRTVGARIVKDLTGAKPWRGVSAVVDDDVFALGIGAPVVVDRVAVGGASCADAADRLLVLDGRKAREIVARAAPELALLQGLGIDGALFPLGLRLLQATDRLEITAAKQNENVRLGARIRLMKR